MQILSFAKHEKTLSFWALRKSRLCTEKGIIVSVPLQEREFVSANLGTNVLLSMIWVPNVLSRTCTISKDIWGDLES